MIMKGVLVNAATVVAGALVGLSFKNLVSSRMAEFIKKTLGFATIIVAVKMALSYENVLVLVSCLVAGGIAGTLLEVEKNTERLAARMQSAFSRSGDSSFAAGFTTTSILFCTGAMAVVGSINSGTSGNHEVLYAKSVLDGVINITFGAIYGIGAAFSALSIFAYQGSIAVLASRLSFLASPHILNDISGVGGIMILMIGTNLAGITRMPVGDYLPAIPLVVLVRMAMSAFAAP